MPQSDPIIRDELMRLKRTVEALEQQLRTQLSSTNDHLRRIHSDIVSALGAIGDERVESQSDYNSKVILEVRKLAEDVRNSYAEIKRCLIDIDADNQIVRRKIEELEKGK